MKKSTYTTGGHEKTHLQYSCHEKLALLQCHEKLHIHYRCHEKIHLHYRCHENNPLALHPSLPISKVSHFCLHCIDFSFFLWDGGWDRALIGKNWISCKWTFLSQMPVIFWSMRKGSVWRELTLSGQVHEFFIPFKMQWSQNQEVCNRDRMVQIREIGTHFFHDMMCVMLVRSVWHELTLSGQDHEFFIPFKMQWSQNQEACNRDRIVQIHEMCTRIFGDVMCVMLVRSWRLLNF